jgi:Flp pilus assembly pilin Flp
MTLRLQLKAPGLQRAVGRFLLENDGRDLAEYALGMLLLAGAAAAGMTGVALRINQAFVNSAAKLTTYTS